MRKYNVAILGATGAVGVRMVQQLSNSTIPVNQLKLLSSANSAGEKMEFNGQTLTVEETNPDSFNDVDLVLASAGGSVSKKFLPEAVKRGAVCVDNTSAYRYEDDVPLVVPEVNANQLKNHRGIIANPNCSTIQMVVALAPIYQRFGLDQVTVSTYQAASGAGQDALDEFYQQAKDYLNNKEMHSDILPTGSDKKHYPLAFNLLPQIDVFQDDGYTREEWKMIHETKKILLNDKNGKNVKVNATCVRVPVPISHGETVYFEVSDKNATTDEIKELINNASGATLQDDPKHQEYPQPHTAVGKRETFVGRIRPDLENKGIFDMWVVADNLLKGAAWNTVENAEQLVNQDLVHVNENDVPEDGFKR